MPDAMSRPPLTFDRAFISLCVGAIWGGVLTDLALTAYFIAGATRSSPWSRPMALEIAKALGFSVLAAVPIILFASIVWLLGLLVVGAPVWWLTHGLGVRSAWLAAAVGAIAPPALYLACSLHGRPTSVIWALKEEWTLYPILAAIGAVVGWTVARSAYRRPESGE
ncbi:hypothetical protein [Caulobacter sp. Root1472]|uniref:hypothetical protein n=1 Tax=Caulobacter sp. Root1472 TaxID=1736470 RepID=UPI000B021F77|nr:hypothetical protein [Caulobacter sp. Root1472]